MFKKYLTQILLVLLMLGIAWGLYLLGDEPPRKEIPQDKKQAIEARIYQTQGDVILESEDLSSKKNIESDFFPVRNWSVREPEVVGESAIIMNFLEKNGEGNILFQKNKEEILPIASLTKIMTAIIVLENFDLEEIIKVSKNSVLTLGDKGGLIRGEELKIRDLLYIMLIESSNDAAMALASDSSKLSYDEFINLMNVKAEELGLKNTSFLDPIGLNSKNKSTVFELAELTHYALDFPFLWEILRVPEAIIYSIDNKFVHNLINTNELLDKISFLRGGKTGFTNDAGGCMLTVSDVEDSLGFNNYLITVVLDSDQRESDTETLINWAKEAYIW